MSCKAIKFNLTPIKEGMGGLEGGRNRTSTQQHPKEGRPCRKRMLRRPDTSAQFCLAYKPKGTTFNSFDPTSVVKGLTSHPPLSCVCVCLCVCYGGNVSPYWSIFSSTPTAVYGLRFRVNRFRNAHWLSVAVGCSG